MGEADEVVRLSVPALPASCSMPTTWAWYTCEKKIQVYVLLDCGDHVQDLLFDGFWPLPVNAGCPFAGYNQCQSKKCRRLLPEKCTELLSHHSWPKM